MTVNIAEPPARTVTPNGDHTQLNPMQERYVFPSSGVAVIIQRVSQQRTADHRNSMRLKNRPPAVPMQTVDIAGEMVTQENPADPQYIAELDAYETAFNAKEFEWFVSKTLTVDTELVRAYREKSLLEDGTDYPEHPDWYLFLWHIAALNMDDFNEFYRIATSISRPTPAAIADAKARF